jgi:small basic protein
MIIAILVGLSVGVVFGFMFNFSFPTEYAFYITMALLAALDSLLGAARSHLEGRYNNLIFISGFIVNAVLAGVLTYLGDLLGVPLYYAAILVFGGRLFNNLAVIRRIIIDRYIRKKTRDLRE